MPMPMPSKLPLSTLLLLLTAILYQVLLRPLLFDLIGLFRPIQPITSFPAYTCRRLPASPHLQACEDMWLHAPSRQLFLSCSTSLSRKEWTPSVGRLNAAGRSLTDRIVAMEIDQPEGDGYAYRVLAMPDFADGPGALSLTGIAGQSVSDDLLRFYVVNTRPSFTTDPDGETLVLADNAKTSPNATIELFEMHPSSPSLRHVRTFADAQIATPNNVAPLPFDAAEAGGGGFYFTNDHGLHKTGLISEATALFGGSGVWYCAFTDSTTSPSCRKVAGGIRFANGLLLSRNDGLLYVPSAVWGGMSVYEILADKSLRKVEQIPFPYPIDNLSEDGDGNIWVPHFPKMFDMLRLFGDPLGKTGASGVSRMKRAKGEGKEKYVFEKIVEDRDGEVLPMTTTAIHDAETGRLFFSSVISPFITVCERVLG